MIDIVNSIITCRVARVSAKTQVAEVKRIEKSRYPDKCDLYFNEKVNEITHMKFRNHLKM